MNIITEARKQRQQATLSTIVAPECLSLNRPHSGLQKPVPFWSSKKPPLHSNGWPLEEFCNNVAVVVESGGIVELLSLLVLARKRNIGPCEYHLSQHISRGRGGGACRQQFQI